MALMLAPYNEAMRIGMGFNSYTQTLCIDDCVRRADGSKASEAALKSVDPSKGVPGQVVKTMKDGQADVSQVVSWSAGFVDKVSDLNHSLNISGALSIKVDALNASASASAHYLNETTSKDSDVRYSIIVKVTNQKLVADDVTQFAPIEYVPESKFQEVYGDCFISGFLEGGVLNGLISKKLLKTNDNTEIGGAISVSMELKVASVKGEAKGEYKDQKLSDTTETQVTVTWSGGGDIKPDDVTTWDIPNLTKVAMDFPDRVALCPQRTYAILTKYTALRSYHEKTVKGSPMDYEIAGLYTNSLLDAYMEYKNMWADLQATIKQLSQGKFYVKKRAETEQMIKYRAEPQKDYEARMKKFNEAKDALTKNGTLNQVVLEEPLPANQCVPYDANDFGLDQAQIGCRLEMIKIVREVNEVTYNPKVATDPSRAWRYLSPAIFRLLVPTDKASLPSIEEIEKMKSDLQAEIDKNLALAKAQKEAEEGAGRKTKELTDQVSALEIDRNTQRDARNKAEGSLDQMNRDYKQLTEGLDARLQLTIIRMEYGGKSFRNIPDIYSKLMKDISEKGKTITVGNGYFASDPTPGVVKSAYIEYKWAGRFPVTIEAGENQAVVLREGEVEAFDIPTNSIAKKG